MTTHAAFSVPGIHCPACAALIRDVSSDFPAITNVDVDIGKKQVTLDYETGFSVSDWSNALAALGDTYTPQPLA